MAQEAHRLYTPLAPATEEAGILNLGDGGRAGVQVTAMSYLPGTRLIELLPRVPYLHTPNVKRFEELMADRATFFTRSWVAGFKGAEGQAKLTGKVGSSILLRLIQLEKCLPSEQLRDQARCARQAFEAGGLDELPIVLLCGDLIPSNILVDPSTWRTTGYVDWAEAEWLPAGMSLYALEHMLSYVEWEKGKPRVVYYEQADSLRESFWAAIERSVPEVRQPEIRKAVTLSRDIGVLLWRGFAWDDGRISRVVNPMNDAEELVRLEAFLAVSTTVDRRDSPLSIS